MKVTKKDGFPGKWLDSLLAACLVVKWDERTAAWLDERMADRKAVKLETQKVV